MEARQQKKLSSDFKKNINTKNFFTSFASVLGFILTHFFKILMFIIFSPLYLFIFIKNWILTGIMTSIVYSIAGFLYYSNLPQYQNKYVPEGTYSSLLWTDSRFYIILILSAVLAFFATVGQFTKD